ncbi:UNVERIFIED_CONTAM: hypothetical protein GTU68_046861, partial [Idotea baltica]|nr:hypothetical protein [Idotea baltica]
KPEIRESYDVFDIGKNLPTEIDNFQKSVSDLINHGMSLNLKILRCLETSLGLEKDTLISRHQNQFTDNNKSLLRILHYPPIPKDVTEGAIRCGEHSDYGTHTLLFQDSMGGLEVKNRKGKWIKANPIEGAILVNVGDLLEMWTNGKFIATVSLH